MLRRRSRWSASLLCGVVCLAPLAARAQAVPWATSIQPGTEDQMLPEDRGANGLLQTLRKLRTWASLMMIVAHPDDEDGGMMTLMGRGEGVRTTLFTLTRGEGGQNAMTADTYDALGLIRTQELLEADRYEGVEQRWGRFADYGFSKTKEEAFAQWGRERVFSDTVRAIRTVRPLVVTSVFNGGITDGHGHHQVSGEMAQEAFLAAGDPKVFPEQIAQGLRPWKPLAVFERVPFAPVTARGMYDYATAKWAPARFYNYVTRQWSTEVPSADVTIHEGRRDPLLGRTYFQIAREGWGQQRSQYGGGTPPLPGPSDASYHRYGSLLPAGPGLADSFFAGVDTTLPGMAMLAHGGDTAFLASGLGTMEDAVNRAAAAYTPEAPERTAPALADGYRATQTLLAAVTKSGLDQESKAGLEHELGIKLVQFQTALVEALGIEVHALVVPGGGSRGLGLTPAETRTHVVPGESLDVRVHATAASGWGSGGDAKLRLLGTRIETPKAEAWTLEQPGSTSLDGPVVDVVSTVRVPRQARVTEPYFHRASIEQAVYDVDDPTLLGASQTPYPLSGWADFAYDGVPLPVGEVVQTVHREPGRGAVYQPLVVVPDFSVEVPQPVAALPTGKTELSVTVAVTSEEKVPSGGTLRLKLPAGWRPEPASVELGLNPGEHRDVSFRVEVPRTGGSEPMRVTAELEQSSTKEKFTQGFEVVGYPGLAPSYLYRPATLAVRPVEVRVAPGLRVGYVMGTGDAVPRAIESLGISPHLLSREELLRGDLSRYDTIVLGVRTYMARPELGEANARLLAWVKDGGTLVVEYQGPEFDGPPGGQGYAPYPLTLSGPEGAAPERVVDERTPVKLLLPEDSLLTTPNRITATDFAGWLEERGHGFAAHWGPEFAALTETADPGQDPQRGGLLAASYGRGRYIYVAYALYRQLPEGVPGAYRLLANLLSAGH